MNDREKLILENKNSQLFEIATHIHRGCVRLNTGNTPEHETTKALVAYRLQKKGHGFITEAIIKSNRKRVDVVDLRGVCYEIVYSEEAESIKQKRAEYPFFIIVVEVGKPLPKELML